MDSTQRSSGMRVDDWEVLPAPIRSRLAELGASALSTMRQADIPARLRPVVRFAPAKRARLGQGPLVTALAESAVFRAAVVDWCRTNQPDALDFARDDPVVVGAAALLFDEPRAAHYVELVAFRTEQSQLRSERDAAVTKADKLAVELSRVRGELAEATEAAERADEVGNAEADRLRKRLREQGVRLKEAKDAAEAARTELERVRRDSEAEIGEMARERDRALAWSQDQREHAERARSEAEVARESAREARQGDEVRLALLLDTVEGALAGLRSELGASGQGPLPADVTQRGRPQTGAMDLVSDLPTLDRLLALPAVHLVVDGYNVTKTGYPDLPLADQRERLARQLAALAARTGVEVTVVFDGADVLSVPAAGPRGVRVLFSEAGVQADDVIRALVEAEPHGRQLVVVTSDRAVVSSVRSRAAHAVASSLLLARMGRP